MLFLRRCAPLALAAAVSACSSASLPSVDLPGLGARLFGTGPQTQPLTGDIRPVRQPLRSELRSIAIQDFDGTDTRRLSLRLSGGQLHGTDPDGCKWRRAADWFAPSNRWSDCGGSVNWSAGSARVRVLDPLYPLEVGAVGRYERSATSHTGRSYTRTTTCRVTDAVEVLREGAAPTPAYVVECDDGRRTRTTWYAPGTGPVAYVERHRKNGLQEAWQRAD